jgi:membrane-associated phospholipid phosphatase
MTSLVSKHPWYDICSLIWFIAAIGCIEIGWKHFWLVSANLFVSFVLRKIIQAKRPVEYDLRLQPMSDLGADSYGFPSLETYMAVVITGHIVLHFKSILLLPFALSVIFIIGVSRLYAKSRFPHQVFGSAILGTIGLFLGLQWCDISTIHM